MNIYISQYLTLWGFHRVHIIWKFNGIDIPSHILPFCQNGSKQLINKLSLSLTNKLQLNWILSKSSLKLYGLLHTFIEAKKVEWSRRKADIKRLYA